MCVILFGFRLARQRNSIYYLLQILNYLSATVFIKCVGLHGYPLSRCMCIPLHPHARHKRNWNLRETRTIPESSLLIDSCAILHSVHCSRRGWDKKILIYCIVSKPCLANSFFVFFLYFSAYLHCHGRRLTLILKVSMFPSSEKVITTTNDFHKYS